MGVILQKDGGVFVERMDRILVRRDAPKDKVQDVIGAMQLMEGASVVGLKNFI